MNTPDDNQLSLFSTPEPPLKSSFCDWEIDSRGYENSIEISGYEPTENKGFRLQINDNTNTKCSNTWISFQESEDSLWQQSSLGEYRQLSLWRSTPTLRQSCDRNSQEYQFTQISETTTQNLESLKLLPQDFRVPAHPTQELERDSNIQLHLFGERDLDVLSRLNPASVLSNSLKELSDEDFELFLADSLWQDMLGRLAMCRQQSLARVIKGSDYLSFPTLTSNAGSTSRPAGQNKCDRWFKDKGLIPSGSQLGTKAIALTMGFPSSWFEGLTEQYSNKTSTPSQAKPQEESEQDISQDEPLHPSKQPSPSAEFLCEAVSFRATSQKLLGGEEELLEHNRGERSSLSREISIPCIVKQPKQPEVKGVIRKDEGDRFVVEVGGETISVSKLFVYPDFSKSVGQIEKSPRKNATPSKKSPRKTRRKKGQGNGTIYCRTVTKNGKEYQEAYYHYTENGKKRTKYIPKKLLDKVKEAESFKLPVGEILILLGGDQKNPRKSSSTSSVEIEQKINDGCIEQVLKTNDLNPRKITPPSKKKRKHGEGTGYVECKPIKRSGKEYKQYWYHYEEWEGGDRVVKKSRYIPKRLVARVEKMEAEKASVRKILEILITKDKRSTK